jgi:hypothetical protein
MGARQVVADVSRHKGAVLSVTPLTETEVTEPTMRKRVGVVALRVVLAVLAVGVVFAGSASSALAEDTCVNAAVRAQSNSTALPDCRAYEMVSSPYKEGFPVQFPKFSDDGTVSFVSAGNFAGNAQGSLLLIDYLATRSSAGWMTTAPAPPETLYASGERPGASAWSADLRFSVWQGSRRAVPGDTYGYWLRGPDGALTRIGDADTPFGDWPFVRLASADLSHIVFSNFLLGAIGTTLLEHVGTGNGAPRVVSVDNDGQPTAGDSCPNAMSDDGRVIVFGSGCGTPAHRLLARVGGTVTVAVSRSECTRTAGDAGGPCNGVSVAAYAGAARDGSRVFFTTRQQLLNGDVNTGDGIDTGDGTSLYAGNDLYACDIPAGVPAPVGATNACGSLTQISGTASDARVENVVAVSDDGSRVFFVAQGVLAGNVGVGDVRAATPNDLCCDQQPHNLYVWERDSAHPAGQTRFVARLPSNDLMPPQQPKAPQLTPDGGFLLFTTANGLVADDSDGAQDVYRYDVSSGVLVRVSTSVVGGGSDSGSFAASMGSGSSMTSDGSTVVFDTAEALSRDDTNGVSDVYAWRAGEVSRISVRGGSAVGITPSGRDLFFLSEAPLLGPDGDVITDIYDARVGGGFEQAVSAPCAGEQCQGQRSQPPGLAGPLAPPSGSGGLAQASPVFSLRAVTAAQRKKLAATGKVSLTVTTNAAGTIGARATATVGGRSVTVGSAKRTLSAPGSVAVGLTLSKKARGQLVARGRLTVKIAVSHTKVALDRSVTLKLTHTTARKSAKRASAVRGGGRS